MNTQPPFFSANLKIGIYEIAPQQILFLQADRNYTKVKLLDGTWLVSTKTLATYEAATAAIGFVRIHKSYIINLYYLETIQPQRVQIKYHQPLLPIARRRSKQLLLPNH